MYMVRIKSCSVPAWIVTPSIQADSATSAAWMIAEVSLPGDRWAMLPVTESLSFRRRH